jgi:hypothetical protein
LITDQQRGCLAFFDLSILNQLCHLPQQPRGHQLNLQRANDRIADLSHQWTEALQKEAERNPMTTRVDRIFHDVL